MKFKDNEIIIEKYLNNLDKFVLDFLKILEKHSDYVIVSGYVSILFGRTRTTEDIDILVPELLIERFKELYKDIKAKFTCINSSNINELFDLLNTKHPIRFIKKGNKDFAPNIEFKFIKNEISHETFKNRIKVKMGKNIMFISPIELQILYKEEILKDRKDLEDALHLREVFKNKLKKEKLKYYKSIIDKYV